MPLTDADSRARSRIHARQPSRVSYRGNSYEIGCTVFIGLCVDKGMTFFGLADQAYALPDHVLKRIGLEVFEYESFAPEKPELDIFTPKAPVLETPSFDQFEIGYPPPKEPNSLQSGRLYLNSPLAA